MSIGRSLFWMGLAQILGFAVQFGAQVVLVRHISLHEAGIYAVALAVVGVLSLLQTLGLQALIVREEVLERRLVTTIFTINTLICLGIAVALVLLSYGGEVLLGDPGVRRVLGVLAAVPLIGIFAFLPAAVLEREGRFKAIALVGTAGNVAGALTTIVLALRGFSYMSAAWGQCANAVAVSVLMMIVGRRHVSFRIGFAAWRRVADFGLQMLAISGVSNLGARLSDILLARMLGLGALGLYSRASSLNGLLWVNLHVLLGRVMLVDFAELHRGGGSLRERYIQTVSIVTAILWPAFAGLAVISAPLILTVYGARWVAAALPLALLSVASIGLVAVTMTYEIFAATGEIRTQTRIEFIRATLALVMFAGGCLVGLWAAAAARIGDALVAIILYRRHINRLTDCETADFMPLYRQGLLLTLAAIAPEAAVMTAFGWAAATPLPYLVAGGLAGILLWVALLVRMRHPLGEMVRRFRRRA
jgi:O-antigen/teichoic acid export membrane protein